MTAPIKIPPCPKCGMHWSRARERTRDYLCLQCGHKWIRDNAALPLLAVAPVLLQVCKDAMPWVAKASAEGSKVAGRLLARMRKAIDKAEGKG